MPRLRVIKCAECRYFRIEGISERCTKEDNTYKNWLGLMYKWHPRQLNLRGNCEDYEKIN
jgi:hypothetical protein